MVDSLERLSRSLAKEREVEMRVGILRIQVQRLAVVVERFDNAALLVVEVAEIELCQWVSRVRRNGLTIVTLGLGEFPLAIVDSSKVHQRAGGFGIQLQHLAIRLDGLAHRSAGF